MASPSLNLAARTEYRRLKRAPDMLAATHSRVRCKTGIAVRAEDGTALLTDHWYASDASDDTILIRTPYGRDDIAGIARFFAERGYHVVVQSCRGTFGSDGVFDPFRHEASDGQATLRWLRVQRWAKGAVHSWGSSYVGLTQWAYGSGDRLPDSLSIAQSARRFDEWMLFPGGGLAIDTILSWAHVLTTQELESKERARALLTAPLALTRGARAVPPIEAITVAYDKDLPFYREWIEHADAGDPWWEPVHFSSDLSRTPPVTLVAGWQDLFLEGQLADYAALRDAGHEPRLVIGDWTHGDPQSAVTQVRELLREDALARAVSVEVTGGGGWRDFAVWPPVASVIERELTVFGEIDEVRPDRLIAALSYRYDPAEPTPAAGGRTLTPIRAGRHLQLLRESRDDVLVFTGKALPEELLLVGTPEIELTLASTNPRVDLFVRLCEVDSLGVSRTVTDGYRRLEPDAADRRPRRIRLSLAPLAHRFAAGHALRLQISSGAHPLYLRNSGTDDPLRDHSRLVPSDQTVFLGGEHPAVLRLPQLKNFVDK